MFKSSINASVVAILDFLSQSFKSDTFEYRLLREIEFRDAKTKRAQSETETEAETDDGKYSDREKAPQFVQKPRNSKLLEGTDAIFQANIAGNPRPRVSNSNAQPINQNN